MAINLTKADIDLLIREPSGDVRAAIASKVGKGFQSHVFTPRERQLAEDIFRLLLRDTEVRVRKALAVELKLSPDAPHDVIRALAEDSTEISAQILEHSPVLTEEDLVEIIQATQHIVRLVAIASRKQVPAPVCGALLNKKDIAVAKALTHNKGAEFDDASFRTLIEQFGDNQSIMEELVYRGGLSYEFAEKLFHTVSDTLKRQLTKRYRINFHSTDKSVENAKETATLRFLSPWMSQNDIQALVNHMHKNKRLTPHIIIRSLCIGDLRFFETAMAKLIGIPIINVRALLSDTGNLGFSALYKNSGMPEEFKDAVRILFRISRDVIPDEKNQQEDFSGRIIERIIEEGHDKSVENMPYLLSVIGRSMPHVPTFH